ncbi:hypothetical protein NKG05_09340 [Oerskovia sp. M15]
MTRPQSAQVHPTSNRAAVVLAAGHDDASRELITRPWEATVVELAVANVRKIVAADRIVVVVAPATPRSARSWARTCSTSSRWPCPGREAPCSRPVP